MESILDHPSSLPPQQCMRNSLDFGEGFALHHCLVPNWNFLIGTSLFSQFFLSWLVDWRRRIWKFAAVRGSFKNSYSLGITFGSMGICLVIPLIYSLFICLSLLIPLLHWIFYFHIYPRLIFLSTTLWLLKVRGILHFRSLRVHTI